MNDWLQLLLAAVLIGTVILAATHTSPDPWGKPEDDDEWMDRQW